ncbi:kelch-like protein 10 [Anarhichas minor]|uniref:kelch-like protein 10 n=1 Tax=Anarhichas minor TaxID=65739 RepID=UPI003F735E1F
MGDWIESSHMSSSVFNSLHLEGKLCDAVIKVEDVTFEIHRIILCRCSTYFLALWSRWSPPDKKVFHIPGLSPDMMQLIIEFAYTGLVSVTEENVQELLLAADQLNVMGVVQTCCDFLGEQLCPENCIGIFQVTDTCLSPELRLKAYHFIVDHFEEVVLSEEFPQLSVQQLADILGRDDLNVSEESAVFEAILRWIAHEPEERKAHLAVLLSKVRLVLMCRIYVRFHVMYNELVENNAECLEMVRAVNKAQQYITLFRPSVGHLGNPLARPRLPNAILLAIGGCSSHNSISMNPMNSIQSYDVSTDLWMQVTDQDEGPRAYHGTAVLNGSIYCVGGFNMFDRLNSVRRFDVSTRTWHDAAPMHHRRCYVSVAVLGECIYAMGGFDGYSRLSTAERYRPETNQWSLIAPMHENRCDASSTTLHNKIYICGGFNGSDFLQTAEFYSPETNQWTMISQMTCQRSGLGIVAYADQVYAVGGSDGSVSLSSAEVYNPRSDTWQQVSHMLAARRNFGIEVLNDQIYVVGGCNHGTCSEVEYYNRTTGEWMKACYFDTFDKGMSCCVLSGLPNMADYVLPRDSVSIVSLDDDEDEDSDVSLEDTCRITGFLRTFIETGK